MKQVQSVFPIREDNLNLIQETACVIDYDTNMQESSQHETNHEMQRECNIEFPPKTYYR